MELEQLINNRKSCRAFSDHPVDPQILRSIIARAARAPSNGNLQPWHIYILTGPALASLKQTTKQQVDDQLPLQTPEYQVYPKPLKDIYDQRRQEIGEDLYEALGIPREDKQKRRGQFAKNALMFNAPVGVFAYIDRSLSYGNGWILACICKLSCYYVKRMVWPHVRKDIGHFSMKLCVRRPARQMILCWRAVLPLDLKIMTRQLTLCVRHARWLKILLYLLTGKIIEGIDVFLYQKR